MIYTSDQSGGVRIVRVTGNWTGDPSNERLRTDLRQWLGTGERHFVFDLSGVPLIASIGLGTLVSAYSTCSREGALLKLAGLSERNRKVAYVTRILDLFEEYDDVDAALRSFVGQAKA
jgi:anti-anti-sigma factor